jgi:hypothetical protein
LDKENKKMINSVNSLKELGYNQELLNLDDVNIGLDGKTVLDRFLESCIEDAGFQIENMIGITLYEQAHTDLVIQPRIKRAEFILAQRNCIEYIFSKGIEITQNLKIEGIEVSSNIDKQAFEVILDMLMRKVKELLTFQFGNSALPRIVTITT